MGSGVPVEDGPECVGEVVDGVNTGQLAGSDERGEHSPVFSADLVSRKAELWRALGSAIIFGLSLSSFLTLFLIPVLYRMTASKREQDGGGAS